ncbi:MAG: hypothetical protein AB7W28_04560 [Armatimonadota bacterium]
MDLAWLLVLVLMAQVPLKDVAGRAPVLDVNAADFPASCIADFAREPEPAGRCGRVFGGTDGRLYFEDGSRAVFWGVNIAKDSVFQPRDVIDRAVEALASAGFNLVRFHHFDDVTGLLPRERAGQKPRIDPERRTCLDYWIHRLGQRGIYVYLDLLDYRTFWPEEGLPDGAELGRGAKPYAVFLPRLIELQAAYARELLCEHVNPYTGRTYAQDPAVLFVELCDENGLFRAAKRGLSLAAPHDQTLQAQFNEWLRDRYGTDEALRRAWTDVAGFCPLRHDESVTQGTVKLGSLIEGNSRDTDTALFYSHVHLSYFAAMQRAVRDSGATGMLLGGVAEPTIPADLRAAGEGLDFIGVNWYWDHPMFPAGRPWEMPYSFHNHSSMEIDDDGTFPVVVAAARVYRKPLVVREWCPCWPNKYRAAGMIEAAAYGALQDVDALLLFHFSANPERRTVGLFDVTHDPVRWGLAAIAGQVFTRRLVPPSRSSVVIGYSAADVLLAPLNPMASPLHRLGYVCRVGNAFFDDELQADDDLVIASGRSSGGKYRERNVLFFANSLWADPYRLAANQSLDERNGCDVATAPSVRGLFDFGGTLFSAGESRELTAAPAYFLPDVTNTPNLRPIGRCSAAQAAFGVRDVTRNRYCFKKMPEELAVRAALDALGQIVGDESLSSRMLDNKVLVSQGGLVTLDRPRNLLLVKAPQVLAIAGDLSRGLVRAGDLELKTPTQQGALVWLSLDGQPSATSKQWVLKMVSIALNTGEAKERAWRNEQGDVYRLTATGSAPVLTLGHPNGDTLVNLSGRPVIKLGLVNGTWELVRDRRDLYLWCDTPGTRIELPLTAAGAQVLQLSQGQREFVGRGSQPLEYPTGAQLLRVSPVQEGF